MKESIFNSSLAITFIYMQLMASTLGLASQWNSIVQVPIVSCLLKSILGIPKELATYDMMALGYSAMTPKPKFLRDKEKMVHYDYCGEESFRTDEEVRDFIRRNRNWALAAHPQAQTGQG